MPARNIYEKVPQNILVSASIIAHNSNRVTQTSCAFKYLIKTSKIDTITRLVVSVDARRTNLFVGNKSTTFKIISFQRKAVYRKKGRLQKQQVKKIPFKELLWR